MLLAAILLLVIGQEGASQSGVFRVIVNSSNPVTSLQEAQLSALFLKREPHWADGRAVMPVDLSDRSPVRASFSQTVHGRDVAAVKSYWQRMIFSGTAVPPPEKATDREVMAFVAQNPGAIGYVGADTRLAAGVKGLSVRE